MCNIHDEYLFIFILFNFLIKLILIINLFNH